MNILVDLALVAILVICALVGRRKGFILTIFDLLGSVVAFLAAFFLSPPLARVLDKSIFLPHFSESFLSSLEKAVGTVRERLDLSQLPGSDAVRSVLSRFGTDSSTLSDTAEGGGALEKIAEKVVSPLSYLVSAALAFVVIFVAALILVKLLARLLDLVASLPVLNASNRILGLVAGILWGLVLVVILSSLLGAMAPSIQSGDNAFLQHFDPEKTLVLRFFRHWDIFDTLSNLLSQ